MLLSGRCRVRSLWRGAGGDGGRRTGYVAANGGKGMQIGCPKEIKTREYRVGLTPAAVREAVAHGHRVLVEAGRGRGLGVSGRRLCGGRGGDRRRGGGGLGAGGARGQGEGAAGRGAGEAPGGAGAVHLPAPGARSGADARADGVGGDGDRLRDGDRRGRRAAAPGADVGGGGAAGAAGRGLDAAEGERRARGAARRRAGGGAGAGGGDRRRRRRHPGGAGGGRDGRRGDGARQGRCRGCAALDETFGGRVRRPTPRPARPRRRWRRRTW